MQNNAGFAWGGKDAGLTKVAGKVAGAFGLIAGAASGLNERLSKGFGELKTRVSTLKDALPENLTTSYEAQLVAAEKTGYAQAAQMGYSTELMGKFSSAATNLGIALNTSTESAGKAVFAWDRGSDVLKTVGIDSKETALKVQEVFGVDSSKFVFTLQEMQKSLGMDDAAIKRLTDSTVAWGQQSGDVNKALGSMQGQVDHLQKRAHAFGKTLEGGELADWAENANQAKQLMFALTGNADKAESAVNALNDQFLEQGRNMGKMFAGTSDDITDWQKHFAIAGADIGQQFDVMKQGPLGFIKGMSSMVKKAGGFANMTGDQMNFIKRQLEEALGPDVADQIFTVFSKGDNAVEDMIKNLPKATEDIGQLAKAAYKTGRTTADWLQLYKDQFTTTLRGSRMVEGMITKNGKTYKGLIPVAQKYLQDSKKGFKELSASLLKLSKDDGPLGQVAGKIMDIQILGAAGLLPESMRAYVPVLEELNKQFGPILMGLGQMFPLLTALASPVVLVVAAFAGLVFWFMSAQKQGDKFSDTLTTMKGQALGVFGLIEDYLVKKFPQYATTIQTVFTGLKMGIGLVMDAVSLAGTGLGLIFDFIESALNGQTHFWADLGETINNIWRYEIVGPIKNYFADLWFSIKKTASDTFTELQNLVQVAVDFWVKILNDAIDDLIAPFKAIDGWVDKLFRHSISSDMKDDFDVAQKHAEKFSRNMSSTLTTATAPMAGVTGNVSIGPNGNATTKLPPPLRPAPVVSASDRDASLISAVHQPNWYARYEQVFLARMAALEAAIRSGVGDGPQGGRTTGMRRPGAKGGNLPKDAGLNKLTGQDPLTGAPTEGSQY